MRCWTPGRKPLRRKSSARTLRPIIRALSSLEQSFEHCCLCPLLHVLFDASGSQRSSPLRSGMATCTPPSGSPFFPDACMSVGIVEESDGNKDRKFASKL